MKFLMAICVIAIHSFLKYIPDYPAMEFVIRMAVPFFFITTGFFLGKKLMKPGADHRQICQSHLKKNLPRYLRWIAVYFPIAMLTLFLSDELWYRFAARYVVGVVLIGETPYAWPLWFLLTVVMYLALVYLFFAKGMSLRNVCITGMIILIAGYVYLNVQESLPGFLKEASKFFSPRIPIGFGAITVGILVAYYERNRMFKIWMGAVLLLAGAAMYYYGIWMWEIVGGTGIFVLGISVYVADRPIYLHLRHYSMIMYFIHMIPLGLLYIFVASEPDMPMRVNFFVITLAITLLLSIPLSYVIKNNPRSAIAQFI